VLRWEADAGSPISNSFTIGSPVSFKVSDDILYSFRILKQSRPPLPELGHNVVRYPEVIAKFGEDVKQLTTSLFMVPVEIEEDIGIEHY
jgi:hypothetical protein